MTTITEDEWDEKYKPINDHPVQWEDLPKDIRINHLWTEVESDDDNIICICAGNHLVNRLGYWYTENPHDYDVEVEVEIERWQEGDDDD